MGGENRFPAWGSVPGFSYVVKTKVKAPCSFCGRRGEDDSLPLLCGSPDTLGENVSGAICESCAVMAAWVWQSTRDVSLPLSAFSIDIAESLVLVLRERLGDYAVPYDVLTYSSSLPGGKIEAREDSKTAAVRHLKEKTGLMTWKSALEPIYLGYSPRGQIMRTYLCRAYFDQKIKSEDSLAEWKPWRKNERMYDAGHYAGYYLGLFEAVQARVALQKASASSIPLSTHLSAAASHYLSLSLLRLAGKANTADLSMLTGFGYSIQGHEKDVLNLVISTEEKRLDLPVRGMPLPEVDLTKPVERKTRPRDEEEDSSDGDESEGDDSSEDSEFVRPAPPTYPE